MVGDCPIFRCEAWKKESSHSAGRKGFPNQTNGFVVHTIDYSPPWTIAQRRRGRRLAVWNGAIWSIGNGLAGTILVVYFARELHAERWGLSVGLIAAAPHVAGLLRLGAPWLIARMGDRKRFCLAAFFLGALFLGLLPAVCAPGRLSSPGWSMAALVFLWCLHHLMQYLGMVALWAWLADLAPVRIRGRFLGWRQRWIVGGAAAAALDAGLFAWGTPQIFEGLPAWLPYAIAAAVGAAFMAAAIVPLALMPDKQTVARGRGSEASSPTTTLLQGDKAQSWVAPFRDPQFRRLLVFGCWFSFFNGITQSAQHQFAIDVLGLSLFVSLAMQTGMSVGQWAASPKMGRLADRLGNRPVLFACQLAVAAGMLFYAAAAPERWPLLIGAWTLWIAYAGTNVCLPNLMLKLSSPAHHPAYIAAYYAVTGLCYAANTILGGALVDAYRHWRLPVSSERAINFFHCLFVLGWLMRSIGALVLLVVPEPKTRR